MEVSQSIRIMLEEIRNYGGDFGDPIVDCIEFDPLEVLGSDEQNHTIGAGIALLVNFASHIDNVSYEDAISSESAKAIQMAIDNRFCVQYAPIFNALTSALASELAFNRSLSKVYSEYVQ